MTGTERPVAVLLSPVLPERQGAGRAMRAWSWVVDLATEHEVHVWVPVADPAAVARLSLPAGVRVWIGQGEFAPPSAWARRLGWLLPGLAAITRAVVADWLRPRPGAESLVALRQAIRGRGLARMVVFRMYLHEVGAALRREFEPASLELDMDDLESATRGSVAGALFRLRRPVEALLHAATGLQYRLLEARLARAYRVVWLAAGEDLWRIGGRACVRPNRIPAGAPIVRHESASVLQLLFVGSLDYPPNEEAVRFLLDAVLPALRARLTAPWRLTIVGRSPPPALRARLEAAMEVKLLADVPDVAPCYARADLVVIPLFAGGGSKLKTIEAFAHGCAVISSRQGVRGLDAVPGRHYWPADDAEGFATGIARLAADPGRRRTLAAEAGCLYERSFRGPD